MIYSIAAGMASRVESSAEVEQHLRLMTKGGIFVSQTKTRNALSAKCEEH